MRYHKVVAKGIAGAIQICPDKSVFRKKAIILAGTPTQNSHCPKRVGTVAGSERPKIKPISAKPTNLTYSSTRLAIRRKDEVLRMNGKEQRGKMEL